MILDDTSIVGQDTGSIFKGFVEAPRLTGWACHFAGVSHVFIQCLDAHGNSVTDLIGDKEEIARIREFIDQDQVEDMLLRVSDSSLEDRAIESTPFPNLKIAVVSTKIENKPVVNWLVCGVLSDVEDDSEYPNHALEGFRSTLTTQQFYNTIDAVSELSTALFQYRLAVVAAEAESRRSRSSEEAMGVNLRRAEALTEIVSLLENEDSIEKIMLRLLETISKFLNIERDMVARVKKDSGQVEVLAAYDINGRATEIYHEPDLDRELLLRAAKPLVLSNNAVMNTTEKDTMERLGIKAVMIMPIIINNSPEMYACFYERNYERTWSIEEIKFINDSVKILQSILTRRVQRNSIASSYESIETILDNVGSAVYVRELSSRKMLFANSIMRKTFAKEIEDGSIDALLSVKIEGESGVCEFYQKSLDRTYDMYYTQITWVDGSPVSLCALYDISEKKVYQRRIEQQAYTDFLTGLYNRMCCERDLARIVDEAEHSGSNGALLYLDLDDFKHINDGLGHQYGDVLLKAISHSIQRVEGITSTCYRMGGDEFVIIIPPESFDRRNHIVAEIKDIFAKPWFLKDADYYCTMSMGMVEFPENGTGVHDLIKKADIAMYEAKKSGKNRMAIYSDNIDSASHQRLDMEKNMRDATTAGFREFEVYYQPIVDIKKPGSPCTGAEALIRWNSQEMGFISPGEFIPLAEYLGLINPIGNYVLMDACNTCRRWNESGYPGYRVNVNLSVVQLLQTDIVEIVENTLKESGINPHNLTLEVTESLAINDMERMKKILGDIKALGVRIALDDFGTGYSSLNHIREIPFDVIKVDQSFIKDLETDSYAGSFVKMVGELAEAIGVNLCVEGVETKEQLDIIKEMPVDLIQGYYFDKPMTQTAFEKKYLPNMH